MLTIKIAAACVTSLAGIGGARCAWHTSVKSRALRLLIVGLGALALAGGVVSIGLAIGESRNARQEAEDTQQILSDLADVRAELKPFVELAVDRFPSTSTEEALTLLAAEVSSLREETEALQGRLSYRPLQAQLREALVSRLSALRSETGGNVSSVTVTFESGSTVRQSLAQELVAILRDAGMQVAGPVPYILVSTGAAAAVGIRYSPGCEGKTEALAGTLVAFMETTYRGSPDPELLPCAVVFAIGGDPLFSPQGTVQFR